MKAIVRTEKYKSGKCLAIYVDNKSEVDDLMIALTEAGFIVNYEPHYVAEYYEGCFLHDDENVIKICCKEQRKRKKGI